jgi:hypothetical protein
MNKKLLSLIVFCFLALLLWYIRDGKQKWTDQGQHEDATISPDGPFNRDATTIIYTKHARCRMECRPIDESEVKEIIRTGKVNYKKMEDGQRGKTYPLEGTTHDNQRVRIVVAPKKDELVVVTVIDLGTDWPCGNCR